MIIDDFDWDKLYEKADVFMRNSNVRTFNVQKGERTLYCVYGLYINKLTN